MGEGGYREGLVMAQEIVLTIGLGGRVEIEGRHYQGQACDTELRALADALGVIEKIEHKPEFFGKVETTTQITQTAGDR